MAYYNSDRGYQRSSYGRSSGRDSFGSRDGGYSRGSYRDRNRYDDRPSKRSGAKMGTGKNKKPYIQGWKATRNGMMKFIAGPTSKGMVSEQSEQWVVKVTVGYNAPQTMTAFYNINSGKLTIPDLNFVLNPKAPNGGYAGPYYKTRR